MLTSTLLGTALGIITGVILTLQNSLFTNLPFLFTFPAIPFAVVVALALIVALLGSYFPLEHLRREKIATTLRA